jgi:membrane protease YdiL (CAAX protease family)
MVALAGVVYSLMSVSGILWLTAREGRPALWQIFADDLWSSVGLGIGFATAVLWFSAHAAEHHAWARTLEEEFGVALGGLSVFQCAALAVASGLGEEVLFRAALQPTLVRLSSPLAAAPALQALLGLAATSLAFGACHFPFRRNLIPWTVFTIVTALGFGSIYLWTGNLVGPIVAHALINGVNLTRIAKRGAPSGPVLAIRTRGGMLEFEQR